MSSTRVVVNRALHFQLQITLLGLFFYSFIQFSLFKKEIIFIENVKPWMTEYMFFVDEYRDWEWVSKFADVYSVSCDLSDRFRLFFWGRQRGRFGRCFDMMIYHRNGIFGVFSCSHIRNDCMLTSMISWRHYRHVWWCNAILGSWGVIVGVKKIVICGLNENMYTVFCTSQ